VPLVPPALINGGQTGEAQNEETRHLMDGILSVRGRMPGLTIVIIEHEMGVMSVSPAS
jgi:ABC-type branched-subunit amino acid transport system ATPase component